MSLDHGAHNVTRRERVLSLLSDLGWHSYRALVTVGGLRYGARVLELRREGYQIEVRALDVEGQEYRLTSLVKGAAQGKRGEGWRL